MIARLRRALALCLFLGTMSPLLASPTLTNYTDLWWTPAESGWGLNVSQQADIMFATFYVYRVNGQPLWFTALLVHQGEQADGSQLFTGDLYQSSGPYFGGPFDPDDVTNTQVGSAAFRSTSPTTATLTYSVGAVTVNKSIERFVLRADNFAGSYVGGTSDITSACALPSNDGIRDEESGNFSISQIGTLVEIRSPRCTYTGTHAQLGQISEITGNYTCMNGAFGTIRFFDMRVEPGGVSGRYTGNGSECDFNGNIGLARRK